jgi:Serine carboxypeptidase
MLDFPEGAIHQFFNNRAVQVALNIPEHVPWIECMPGAGRRRLGKADALLSSKSQMKANSQLPGKLLLENDRPISVVPYVAELLDESGIRVLIYSGDRDMTTNAQGSEMLLDTMEWSGAKGWADTRKFERGLWLPGPGQFGGYIKKFRNLGFLVVSNSGHLVPFNRDEIALDLITRFLGDVSFLDKPLPKFTVRPKRQPASEKHKVRVASKGHRHEPTGGGLGSTGCELGWSVLVAAVGFVLGFLVSRRLPKDRRGGYEMIPSHHETIKATGL